MSEKDAEKFRQEGREEVLNWLVQQEILNYSIPDNVYFRWDWKKEILTYIPWRRSDD